MIFNGYGFNINVDCGVQMNPMNPNIRSREITKAIEKIQNLETLYPGIIQHEMLDFLDILEMGAKKYDCNNWLEPNGKRSSEKDMHDSMGHHWAESMVGKGKIVDVDSNKDPLLHLACRALMTYTRRQRNIIHPDDK